MDIWISAIKEKQAVLEYYVKKYGFSLLPNQENYELFLNSDGLELIQKDSQTKALKVDFNSAAIRKRLKHLNKELLIKAIGKKNKNQNIVDATAGLAQDAYLLAAAGHRLTLIERSNIVAALLEDALSAGDITNNMNLIFGDASKLLATLKTKPEIIYLDPMYPKTSKKAAQKKGMQFFREILAPPKQQETEELLQISLQTAKKRVIVKRPIKALPIGNKKPSAALKGKTTRFDIYIV